MEQLELLIPVGAALTSAALTGGVLFGIERWREQRREREQLKRTRTRAYSDLLAVTGALLHTAHALRVTLRFRSGLPESLSVLLRMRSLAEPFDIDSRLREDYVPLHHAWAVTLTWGSPEAAALATRLVEQSSTVLDRAVRHEDHSRSRFRQMFLNVRWSASEDEEWHAAMRELARLRGALKELARQELGLEALQHDEEAQLTGAVDQATRPHG